MKTYIIKTNARKNDIMSSGGSVELIIGLEPIKQKKGVLKAFKALYPNEKILSIKVKKSRS